MFDNLRDKLKRRRIRKAWARRNQDTMRAYRLSQRCLLEMEGINALGTGDLERCQTLFRRIQRVRNWQLKNGYH